MLVLALCVPHPCSSAGRRFFAHSSRLDSACPTSADILQISFQSSKLKLVGVSVKRNLRALASSFASGFGKYHYRCVFLCVCI